MGKIKWAYGVTTVASRVRTYLPATLQSLKATGFDNPHLFVDSDVFLQNKPVSYNGLTVREPAAGAFGNWWLSLVELLVKCPTAQRFALFQDDIVTCKNLRNYLDGCRFPDQGYWNLFTFASNQSIAPERTGWYESNQLGRGAMGLVFDRSGVLTLLRQKSFVEKPLDCTWGRKKVDGAVVDALKEVGYKEYVHSPCLTQHTGEESSVGNMPHAPSKTFVGEDFDALSLLG